MYLFGTLDPHPSTAAPTELQKHADRADQLVLFFVPGANFWEKHVKNCAIMSILDYFWSILDLLFGANFFGGKNGRC